MTIIARIIDAEGVTWIPEIALPDDHVIRRYVELPVSPKLTVSGAAARSAISEGGEIPRLLFRTARAEWERVDGGGVHIFRVRCML